MDAFILDNIFWVSLALVSTMGLSWTFVRDGQKALSPNAAIIRVNRDNGLFLDVRSEADFSGGHIPRARNIPFENIQNRLSIINKYKQKTVVVVCQSGSKSKQVVKQLQNSGFEKVLLMAGGMNAWLNERLPLLGKKK